MRKALRREFFLFMPRKNSFISKNMVCLNFLLNKNRDSKVRDIWRIFKLNKPIINRPNIKSVKGTMTTPFLVFIKYFYILKH